MSRNLKIWESHVTASLSKNAEIEDFCKEVSALSL
jgi:hypothetical protein